MEITRMYITLSAFMENSIAIFALVDEFNVEVHFQDMLAQD
jgi:hypothetical protein